MPNFLKTQSSTPSIIEKVNKTRKTGQSAASSSAPFSVTQARAPGLSQFSNTKKPLSTSDKKVINTPQKSVNTSGNILPQAQIDALRQRGIAEEAARNTPRPSVVNTPEPQNNVAAATVRERPTTQVTPSLVESPFQSRINEARDREIEALRRANDVQADIDAQSAQAGVDIASREGQGRGITLPFVTGQQAAIRRQLAAESAPLEARLANLQRERLLENEIASSLESRQDDVAGLAKTLLAQGADSQTIANVLNSGSLQEGLLRASESDVFKQEEEDKVLSLEESRELGLPFGTTFDAAAALGIIPDRQAEARDTQVIQAGGRSLLVDTQTGETIQDLGATDGALARSFQARQAAIDRQREESEGPKDGGFLAQLGRTAQETLNDLRGRVGFDTVGFASLFSDVPTSDARNFASDLDTLKSDIGFGILQEMRNASKTGGALGQVSERELAFLQATLGSLDQGQSQANFNKNLDKIEQSIQRWTDEVEKINEGVSVGGGSFRQNPDGSFTRVN